MGARALTSGGDGRFDSAIATLADGREAVIRVATDDETTAELSSESLALRALTAGARALLPISIPEFLGETLVGTSRSLVVSLIDGFQIDASHIPAGRGAAASIGAAIAAVHTLPPSVVRSAGLSERNPAEIRESTRRLIDRAAETGHVSARLTVRWREAVERDDLWRFESMVTLGGAQASSFVFHDDPDEGPAVVGILGWHGLSIGDPAVDLAWLSAAPDAAQSVHDAYSEAALHTPDAGITVRARLLAELDFARWLVHGTDIRDDSIVTDATALLEALADSVRDDELVPRPTKPGGVDDALSALEQVPETTPPSVDTSMQTDAYDPGDLMLIPSSDTHPIEDVDLGELGEHNTDSGDAHDGDDLDGTEHDSERVGTDREDTDFHTPDVADTIDLRGTTPITDENPDVVEAQRAARAAFQRWTSSSSE